MTTPAPVHARLHSGIDRRPGSYRLPPTRRYSRRLKQRWDDLWFEHVAPHVERSDAVKGRTLTDVNLERIERGRLLRANELPIDEISFGPRILASRRRACLRDRGDLGFGDLSTLTIENSTVDACPRPVKPRKRPYPSYAVEVEIAVPQRIASLNKMPKRPGRLDFHTVLIRVGVGIAYVAAAEIGFRLAFVAEQVTTVWAPTGIAIASLLIWGPRLWPAIWLGRTQTWLAVSDDPAAAVSGRYWHPIGCHAGREVMLHHKNSRTRDSAGRPYV